MWRFSWRSPRRCRVLPRVRPQPVYVISPHAFAAGGLTRGKTLHRRATRRTSAGISAGGLTRGKTLQRRARRRVFPSSLQINHVSHYLVDVIVVMGIDVVLVPSLGIVNDILRYVIMGALVADDMVEITLLP